MASRHGESARSYDRTMNSAEVDQLIGDGFVLRPIAPDDAPLLVEASATDIPEWTYLRRNLSVESATSLIERGEPARMAGFAVRFVIDVDGEAVGTVGAAHAFDHDHGIVDTFYFVLPQFRRRGHAARALTRMDEWLTSTSTELRRLQLYVMVDNPGSAIVAERAGYQREGVLANMIPAIKGYGPRDVIVFGKRAGEPG